MISFSDLKVGMVLKEKRNGTIWTVLLTGSTWCCVQRDQMRPIITGNIDWVEKIVRPSKKVYIVIVQDRAGATFSWSSLKQYEFIHHGYTLISKKEIEIEDGEGF